VNKYSPLAPSERRTRSSLGAYSWRFHGAVVIGVGTLIGHLIPLLPFLMLPQMPVLVVALVLSAFALFGVGFYSARNLVGDWRSSGVRMVVIGLGAAALGFLIGLLFHTAGA
jgi:VIT1/CCC1 family predicted Fe2+/Mn2+ transporter